MVTLVSAALGLAGSLLPEALGLLKNKQKDKKELESRKLDYEQELKVLDKQAVMAEKGHLRELDLREMSMISKEVDADLKMNLVSLKAGAQQVEGGKMAEFINCLNSSCRPIITYMLMIFMIGVHVAAIFSPEFRVQLPMVWTPELASISSIIIAYHFGNRSLHHVRKLK